MTESAPSVESFSDSQKEAVMQYLRDSSHEEIGQELRIANSEEVTTAERINSLDLKNSGGRDDTTSYPDSNYTPDAIKRGRSFQEAGLDQDSQYEIEKRDIVLNRGSDQMFLKWIGFTQYDEALRKYVVLPGGTVFFGKTVYRESNGQDDRNDPRSTVFKNLSPEEVAKINEYIDREYPDSK